MPIVGTPTDFTRAGKIIQSIRAQIPDPVADPAMDGSAFSAQDLIRWINDAGREICMRAPVITDWCGIASEQGMDVYELTSDIIDVHQLWYDNWGCWRAPEMDALFTNKVQSRSYFFGPHSIHERPRLHVWPAADRTAASSTLSAAVSATDKTFSIVSLSNWKPWGHFFCECEEILYRTASGTTITNTLRGQCGTIAEPHPQGAVVQELNIVFKCWRLPVPITGPTDPMEIPQGLHPLIELYVIAKVREAEQEHAVSLQMLREFDRSVDRLAEKGQIKGIRQGLQVRTDTSGPHLRFGRVYVP